MKLKNIFFKNSEINKFNTRWAVWRNVFKM